MPIFQDFAIIIVKYWIGLFLYLQWAATCSTLDISGSADACLWLWQLVWALTLSAIESDATYLDCFRMDLGIGFGTGYAYGGDGVATIGSVGVINAIIILVTG